MDTIEQECAAQSLERRVIVLPNSSCEIREVKRVGENAHVLLVIYAQGPGFSVRTPCNTQRSLDPEIREIQYETTPHYGRSVRTRVPVISHEEESGE